MRNLIATTTIGLLCTVASSTALAQQSIEIPCTGSPPEAVTELPEPLRQWGTIRCTVYGHVLAAKDKWVWSYPGAFAPVFLPAQMVRDNPARVGNSSYFKQLVFKKLDEAEASGAAAAINSKLGTRPMPVDFAFDLTLTNNEGDAHQVRFVQTTEETKTGKGLWGFWCSPGCKDGQPFMLLNFEKKQ